MLVCTTLEHCESPLSARSRFRSGPPSTVSGERFGQAHSRSAADEDISPAVIISSDARCDCRIVGRLGRSVCEKRSPYIRYGCAICKRSSPRGVAAQAITRSSAIAQDIHQQRESRRGLAAAWIIEVIARKRRAPVGKHPHQAAGGDVRPGMPLHHIGESKAVQRRAQQCARVIEHQLAVDAHIQRASVLLEFPDIDAAMARQAQVDAAVAGQLLRRARLLARSKIGGRTDDRHAQVRPTRTATMSRSTSSPGRMPASYCAATMLLKP